MWHRGRSRLAFTAVFNLLPTSTASPLPGFDVECRLRFPDDARAAVALPKLRAKLIAMGKPDGPPAGGGLEALWPALQTSLRAVSVHREQSVLVISMKPRWSGKEIEASGKKPSMSTEKKLRQVGLAMFNYEATFGRLPTAATRSADGKPLYSWRVELLPFLEQDGLYREFNRKEVWDHPDNKRLLGKMPAIFAMDATDPGFVPGRTRFQVLQSKGGVFDGDKSTKLAEITDGSSSTLLVVEAGEPIEWTRPDELRFDPKGAMPKLGNPALREFLILRGDASTQPIARDISAELFRPLVTMNANDIVQWSRLRAKRN